MHTLTNCAGVAGPDYLAYHISYYKERKQHTYTQQDHERVALSVYVDLVLLARAHCVVWAPSGFPLVAMVSAAVGKEVGPAAGRSEMSPGPVRGAFVQTLGFNPCTVDVPSCIEEAESAAQMRTASRQL